MEVLYFKKYRFALNKGEIIDIDPFLKNFLTNKLKESRYLHSLSVAKLMYDIALSNKLDNPLRYYVCGLLHDVGKYETKETEFLIMKTSFKEYLDLPEYAYHSFTGAYIVKNILGIDDEELLEAIEFHTTGKKNMSDISKILFAADKIDPLRNYDSSYMIRMMKDNFNTGFIEVVKETKKFLKDKHNDTNYLSEEMYRFYI